MSNPAVVDLKNGVMSIGSYRLEDNIGESIHLHIGEWRFDLTIKELDDLACECGIAINNFLSGTGFNYSDYDPLFLSQISDYLPDLIEVRDDKVRLKDLRVDTSFLGFFGYGGIEKSRVFKAYKGKTKEDERYRQVNRFGETNEERRNALLESVRKNGYPFNNNYIILFNNQNIVRDGQHRAAALYYLYGDMEISVKRLIFKDGKHNVSVKNLLSIGRFRHLLGKTKQIIKHLLRLWGTLKKRVFLTVHKNTLREFL